jgi:thiamine biosynthesis lipoprotein ApbE
LNEKNTIMRNMKLKSIANKFSWIFFLLIFVAFVSCNNSTKQNNARELTKEMQDVKHKAIDIMEQEKKELEAEVDSVITEFNTKFYDFEEKFQEGTKEVNAETQELMSELKAQSDTLSMRAEEIQGQSEENWHDFKEELQHETENFKDSIIDFFQNNRLGASE